MLASRAPQVKVAQLGSNSDQACTSRPTILGAQHRNRHLGRVRVGGDAVIEEVFGCFLDFHVSGHSRSGWGRMEARGHPGRRRTSRNGTTVSSAEALSVKSLRLRFIITVPALSILGGTPFPRPVRRDGPGCGLSERRQRAQGRTLARAMSRMVLRRDAARDVVSYAASMGDKRALAAGQLHSVGGVDLELARSGIRFAIGG